VWERLLGPLNRVPVGERCVRIEGMPLYADSLDRWVAALGWRYGWLARREALFRDRTLQPGMVTVDVGANLGFHTLGMARRVGPGGRVHALEPDPDHLRLLTRAVRESGVTNVVLHDAAATDTTGTARLYLAAANRGDNRLVAAAEPRAFVDVRTVRVDDLVATESRVDFVKIDAQGAEVEVLRGMPDTLRRPGVQLLCELSPALLARAGHDREAFFAPLRALGFAPRHLRPDGATVATTEDAAWATAVSSGHDMIVLTRDGASG
jgi:FkbM family methyltransferase